MTDRFLSYGRHLVTDDDIRAVEDVLRSDFLTQGTIVPRFEEAVADRVQARHAVAVSSGTAALHLACLAAGVRKGDVGVVSALTFVATGNAVRYCGGEVRMTDVDPRHLGMAPQSLKAVLADAPEAKVVLPVLFGGLGEELDDIRRLSEDRLIVEDAAQALGGTYATGEPIGSCAHADMAIFSLHPVKSITTGEGGLITTNDDELARRLRALRNHGIERDSDRLLDDQGFEDGVALPWYYEQQVLGFNYRLTDVQAALGLSQLGRLDTMLARRTAIALRYDAALVGHAGIDVPQADPEWRQRSANHLYVVVVDYASVGTTRRGFLERLRRHNVGGQVHFLPMYRHPYYRERYGVDPSGFPALEAYNQGCLSLPLHPGLTDAEVERVITAVGEAVAG